MTKKIELSHVLPSFTDGTRPCFVARQQDERDVLAEALWLERHGRVEEAERVLDAYCLQ